MQAKRCYVYPETQQSEHTCLVPERTRTRLGCDIPTKYVTSPRTRSDVLPKTQIESLLNDIVIRQHRLWKNMKTEYQ